MNLKKILAATAAGALAVSSMAVSAFAADMTGSVATYVNADADAGKWVISYADIPENCETIKIDITIPEGGWGGGCVGYNSVESSGWKQTDWNSATTFEIPYSDVDSESEDIQCQVWWIGGCDAITFEATFVLAEEPVVDEPTVPTLKANIGTSVANPNKIALIDELKKDSEEVEYQSVLTGTDVKFTDVYGVNFIVTVGDDTKATLAKEDGWVGGGMGFNSESTGWDSTEWSFQDGVKDITAVANEDGTYTFSILRENAVFAETDTYAQVWLQNWATSDFTYDKVELLGANGEAIFVIENDANADVPGTVEKADEPSTDEPKADEPSTEEPTTDEPTTEETPKDDAPATGVAVAFAGLALAGTAVVATKKRK